MTPGEDAGDLDIDPLAQRGSCSPSQSVPHQWHMQGLCPAALWDPAAGVVSLGHPFPPQIKVGDK